MADNYYVKVVIGANFAVLLLTSDGQWRLRSDSGLNFAKNAGQGGAFKLPWGAQNQYEFTSGESSKAAFRMSSVVFPPNIVMEPSLFENQFQVGEAWSKALGFANPTQAVVQLRAHWYPIATGALMSWIKQYTEGQIKEAKRMALSLGLNLAALADPTGVVSGAAAIEASDRGDYLGCALNLLGVIPLIGKAADAVNESRLGVKLNQLLGEIRILTRWLQESKTAVLRTAGLDAKGLEGLMTAAKTAISSTRGMKNLEWILPASQAKMLELGMLPAEFEALSALAKQGYYFVVRACNPERVKWLEWAARAGVRTLSKPLWIKAKSLKGADFLTGLVGYKLSGAAEEANLMTKVEAPAGFLPRWLERGGAKVEGVYKINPSQYHAFDLVNDANASTHFLVKTKGYVVLCDAKGSAYVSDLDVVLIQRRLASGGFAPPGMNVGPKNIAFVGGDNAALRPFWNGVFGRVKYPPGYEAIQHGEATGTAGNFKAVDFSFHKVTGEKVYHFNPRVAVRKTVWSPKDAWDTEQLVVACQADGLPSSVGWAKNWTDLVQFHNENPMGQFRIPK